MIYNYLPGLIFGILFLPLTNISAQLTISDSLVAHWSFDGDYMDISKNRNDGQPVGGVEFTTDRNGVENGALLLNGIDAYVVAQNSNSLSSPTVAGSISAWIRVDDWFTNQFGKYFFFCEKTESRFNYQYTTAITESINDPADPEFMITSYTTNVSNRAEVAASQVKLGEWVCATVTWAANEPVTFYLGDTLLGKSNTQLKVNKNSGPVEIGRSPGGELEFSKGAIDELRIYNRALSTTEVAEVCKVNTTATHNIDHESDLRIFPNPASSALYVTSADNNITNVEVFTVGGQLISAKIDRMATGYRVSTNYRGIAIIQVHTDRGVRSERVVFYNN